VMTEKTDHDDRHDDPRHDFHAIMRHDWQRVTMIHFALPPDVAARLTPFDVETWAAPPAPGLRQRGHFPAPRPRAFVSLVFFTLNRLRTPRLPRLSRALLRPISDHQFVNLRTYVRHRGEPGIYFIREWLDNRLAVLLGPATFGLPYRHGTIRDETLLAPQGRLAWRLDEPAEHTPFAPAPPRSLDHFLLERYTAFTLRRSKPACFRIRHEPWPIRRAAAIVTDDTLLRATTGRWPDHTRFILAHQSPGVRGVEVSRPYRLRPTPTPRPEPPLPRAAKGRIRFHERTA